MRTMTGILTGTLLLSAAAVAQLPFDDHLIGTGFRGHDVVAADLDGDGLDDLAYTKVNAREIGWVRNTGGDPRFAAEILIADGLSGNRLRSLAAVDLDQDGDIDIVSGQKTGDHLQWHENLDGTGTSWQSHVLTDSYPQIYEVLAADINDDGEWDLVATSRRNTGRIAWFENDGEEAFTEHIIEQSTEIRLAYGCDVGDLDQDGRLDVALFNEGTNDLFWYEHDDGDGLAWTRHYVATINDGRRVRIADLDGDGDRDLAASTRNSTRLHWYENLDGDGTSWDEHVISTQRGAEQLRVSDLDEDGDLDLVIATHKKHKFGWYENDGSGGFVWHELLDTRKPHGVVVADLDNDGDLDLGASTERGNSALWFLENRTVDPGQLAESEHVYYEGWTLMSVPYDLTGQPNTAEDVIGDDLPDLTSWQLISFLPNQGMWPWYPAVPDDPEAPRPIEVGRGFWLGIANADSNLVDVEGAPVVGDVELDLAEGWNMLGYPYLQPGDITDWMITREGVSLPMIEAAADSGWVVPIIHVSAPEFTTWGYWYNFGATTEIEPWYGFWFLARVDGLTLTMTDPGTAPGPVIADLDDEGEPSVDYDDWWFRIFSRQGDGAARVVEMGATASTGDGYDITRDWPVSQGLPAQAGDDHRLLLPRPDWPADVGSEYQADLRAPFDVGESKVWTMQVQGTGEIELSWPGLVALVPEGYSATIDHLDADLELDMFAVDSYVFTASGTHEFEVRITAGANDALAGTTGMHPERFELGEPYPNPFNPAVTVPYTVPAAADVNVTVYDVLGREVTRLVHGRRASGTHQVVWNAAGHAAGVYFVRFQSAGHIDLRKVVLVK